MPEQLFANTASTTITSTITAVQTTIPVASSASFPTAVSTQDQEYQAAFVDDSTTPPTIREYITVRNTNTSTSWTVIRQSEDPSRFPAGAWASGTRIVHVFTAAGFRDLLPRARNVFQDVRDYGAVGTNSSNAAGAVDCSQPIKDAADAANVSLAETYKTDANGTGTVFLPGNRDYKLGSTIEFPEAVRMIGGTGSGGGVSSPARLRWHGSVGGTMVQMGGAGQNMFGAWVENIVFSGRSGNPALDGNAGYTSGAGTAWRYYSAGGTAKVDMGMGFEDCWFQNFSSDAVRLETGATNYHVIRGRADTIGGYVFYVEASTHSFYGTISGMTWDNAGPNSGGFLFLDGETAADNHRCYVGLNDLHLEVNSTMTQTYIPTGWSPTNADTRGVIRLGVSTAHPGTVQHSIQMNHLWLPVASGLEAFSVFQFTSSPLTADNRARHARAAMITGGPIFAIQGTSESATGAMKFLGGVAAADGYRYEPGTSGGPRKPLFFTFNPTNASSVPGEQQQIAWMGGRTVVEELGLPSRSTVGAAGGGTALPATPVKYLDVYDEAGTRYQVPAYTAGA